MTTDTDLLNWLETHWWTAWREKREDRADQTVTIIPRRVDGVTAPTLRDAIRLAIAKTAGR